MTENQKLTENIEKFREQNSDLKNMIKRIDDEVYDPRTWIVGLFKTLRSKSTA